MQSFLRHIQHHRIEAFQLACETKNLPWYNSDCHPFIHPPKNRHIHSFTLPKIDIVLETLEPVMVKEVWTYWTRLEWSVQTTMWLTYASNKTVNWRWFAQVGKGKWASRFLSKPPTHYNNQQKRSNISSHKPSESEAFIMAMSRAMEEITPGPQKEGKTRSTLTFTKPQDQLHFQVSLTIVLIITAQLM